MKMLTLWLLSCLLLAAPVQADSTRASELYRQLRCITCQSQSVADSNAPLAQDIRRMVDEEIKHGKTDEEILSLLASRYGDAILMTPPLTTETAPLWYGPLTFLVIGLLLLFSHFRNSSGRGVS